MARKRKPSTSVTPKRGRPRKTKVAFKPDFETNGSTVLFTAEGMSGTNHIPASLVQVVKTDEHVKTYPVTFKDTPKPQKGLWARFTDWLTSA